MTRFEPITGHCQCGAVRYRVTMPAERAYHCHCSMCRRMHGTVFATYALVPRQGLAIEAGADNLSVFSTSPPTHRKFCKTCGCQMFIDVDTKPHLVWYTPGTADGHPGHPPETEAHIFVDSKVEWYEIHGSLPQRAEGTESARRA